MLNGSLEGELEDELGYEKYDVVKKETDNSRNGYGDKRVKTRYGEVDIKVPRDSQGEYEPKLVSKHQKMLNEEIERKIISMYAKGDDDQGYGSAHTGIIRAGHLGQHDKPDNG